MIRMPHRQKLGLDRFKRLVLHPAMILLCAADGVGYYVTRARINAPPALLPIAALDSPQLALAAPSGLPDPTFAMPPPSPPDSMFTGQADASVPILPARALAAAEPVALDQPEELAEPALAIRLAPPARRARPLVAERPLAIAPARSPDAAFARAFPAQLVDGLADAVPDEPALETAADLAGSSGLAGGAPDAFEMPAAMASEPEVLPREVPISEELPPLLATPERLHRGNEQLTSPINTLDSHALPADDAPLPAASLNDYIPAISQVEPASSMAFAAAQVLAPMLAAGAVGDTKLPLTRAARAVAVPDALIPAAAVPAHFAAAPPMRAVASHPAGQPVGTTSNLFSGVHALTSAEPVADQAFANPTFAANPTAVRLRDLLDVCKPAMDPAEFEQMSNSPNADRFVTLDTLRTAGIWV